MSRALSIVWMAVPLWMCAGPSLFAQDQHSLAINLSVVGTPQVGVTYQVSNSLALRPALTFSWSKNSSTIFGAPTSSSRVGLELAALLVRRNESGILPYVGASGGLSFDHSTGGAFPGNGHTVTAAGLFGLRARVVSRVYLYGELALRYEAARGSTFRSDLLALRTMPLGVLIYLK